ncbi:hypothetical protein [Kitasatospora sp. NPDC127116]|uniref:hypothetical protein n=1 Tax=Kitasatospora sp. NPDC127116 TaxID=3345367 RepID=UPI00363464EC
MSWLPPISLILRIGSVAVDGSIGVDALKDAVRCEVAQDLPGALLVDSVAGLVPGGQWEERRTPGTFTLPAHVAFFSGFLPKLPQPKQPPRLWECRPPAFKTVDPRTFVFDAPNLLVGLGRHGYRTVCIGGVTYFSRETPLGSVLPDMFDEDFWRPDFCSPEPDSTRPHASDPGAPLARSFHASDENQPGKREHGRGNRGSSLMLDLPAVRVVATAVVLDGERGEAVVDPYREITAPAWTAAGVRH